MALSDNGADKVSVMGGGAIDFILLQIINNYMFQFCSLSGNIFFFGFILIMKRKKILKERENK